MSLVMSSISGSSHSSFDQ